jgi:hypothetical protein
MTSTPSESRMGRSFPRAGLVVSAILLLVGMNTTRAENSTITSATLVDRAQIEDMLVDYYALIDKGTLDYSAYYVSDGVLDVNGVVCRGAKQIEDLYRKMFQMAPSPPSGAKFHLTISNEKIVVNGSSAIVDLIWMDTVDKSPTERPFVSEQGREHDELVKQGGRWLLKARIIRTDAGRLIGSTS